MALPAFELSYDYRCPFAKNIHLHVITALRAGGELDVAFAPWTMSQGHRAPGAPDVWDDPSKDSELLSLAYSTSIRDQQTEHFLDAHEALFRGRHEKGIRLISHEEIADVLKSTGVNIESARVDVESRHVDQNLVIKDRHSVVDFPGGLGQHASGFKHAVGAVGGSCVHVNY